MTADELDSILGTSHYFPKDENPVYIKKMQMSKGMFAVTHSHKYDHWGVLGVGDALVEIDGESKLYSGTSIVNIPAGKQHKITAMTDTTWLCIHHVSSEDTDDIDKVLISGD